MFKSLLVPLDGSEFSERSLPLVRGIAQATGASLHLAHVHVPHPPDDLLSNPQFHFEGLDMAEYDDRHCEEEREYLTRVTQRMDGVGSPADCALLQGNVADELATYAEQVGAEVIFMTTHGRTGLSRVWFGSIADSLMHHTHLPLLVIHPDKPEHVPADVRTFEHGLVLLDGSDLAETILESAASLAQATGSRLTLTHVVSSRGLSGVGFLTPSAHIIEALDRAEEYLAAIALRLRADGIEVDTCVRVGDRPAPTIKRIAETLYADVIAIATHGYGGLKKAILGSVAEEILRSSPVPLLVRRPVIGERSSESYSPAPTN
jgi:nucleotide-binding universal stress UspA family protein